MNECGWSSQFLFVVVVLFFLFFSFLFFSFFLFFFFFLFFKENKTIFLKQNKKNSINIKDFDPNIKDFCNVIFDFFSETISRGQNE